MSELNKTIKIGKKTLPNRFAYLPTESNTGDNNGSPTGRTAGKYVQFAQGGPGILFLEAVTVDYRFRAREHQLCISEKTAAAFRELIGKIREAGSSCPVVVQLDHPGILADPGFSKKITPYRKNRIHDCEVLGEQGIEEVLESFKKATWLVRQIGADGVDIKHAHGFFCGELLRPANLRDDQYGRSFENRTRFFQKYARYFRDTFQDDFFFGIRISAYEGIKGGFGCPGSEEITEDLSEPVKFAREAETAGASFLSVSAGHAAERLDLLLPNDAGPDAVFRQFGWAETIKKNVSIPVIGAGYSYLGDGRNQLPGVAEDEKSFQYWAEKNIGEGNIDVIGLGRQAMADPLFAKKYLAGSFEDINYCTACGNCGDLLVNQKVTGCVHHHFYYNQ